MKRGDLQEKKQGQVYIIEYVGAPGKFIYGFGTFDENGDVNLLGEETFGSLPQNDCPVLCADGSIVSNEDYQKKLDEAT